MLDEKVMDRTDVSHVLCRKGFLGAALRPGNEGQPGMANGDSILMDFQSGFFAVSDSSDRNPSFAGEFLRGIADIVAQIPYAGAEWVLTDRDCRETAVLLQQRANDTLRDFLSSASCTLTGMLFVKTEQGMQGLVVHTGDSLLFLYDGSVVSQVSRTNFWMVGRTTRLFQIGYIPLPTTSRLLFSTDGLSCLKTSGMKTKEALIGHLFSSHPTEYVPEALLELCSHEQGMQDDLALISMNPSKFVYKDERIIWGGDQPDAGREADGGRLLTVSARGMH